MEAPRNTIPNIAEKVLIKVDSVSIGKRLDMLVTEQLPDFSRSFFKRLIAGGHIAVNGARVSKSGYSLRDGDQILVSFPSPEPVNVKELAAELDVRVIYEHPDFLIISKPAGLIVHAPRENYEEVTLVDWLIHHFSDIASAGAAERPGIVHRLDMHTSGLMVIPRNSKSHAIFTDMFKDRTIKKTYLAVVKGHPDKKGVVDYHIVRHPVHRNKMTYACGHELSKSWARRARHAVTHYEVKQYFDEYSLVEAKPVTGRTHQIRVHMASVGHPLIGDEVYGQKTKLIDRQALHAYKLEFEYAGKPYSFICEPPADIAKIVE